MKLFIIIFFTLSTFINTIKAQNIQYKYDNANRLTQVIYPNQITISYTYDKDGNRITAVTSIVVLPITLLNFKAQKQNSEVLLTWSTSQEFNSDKFEVEFSKDGTNFQSFISLPAKGVSATKTDYSTLHCCPIIGVNYYRLKMIDRDGNFKYSETREVKFDFINEMKIYPNPVMNFGTLNILLTKAFNSDASVVLYDSKGSQVLNTILVKGATLLPININKLASGSYSLKVMMKDEIFQAAFVKQ